ncbi:MAG: hypothetical protein ACI4LN_05580, partial [Anaerovoracaceae bacterium]
LTSSQVKAITPAAKAASYSYSKIKVTWDKIDGLDGYIVYRATSKNGTYSKAFTTTKNSYINTGRTTGKYYYYKVRGYKKINGKTVYTKYSPVTATYARPNKVKINEVYGTPEGLGRTTLDWDPVTGASHYECQVNRKKNGVWTGWKNYVYGIYDRKETFDTYYTLLADEKKQNPSGYVTTLVDGEVKTLPVKEDIASRITKTQAWIDIADDNSIYKFRVRAYRTVNGKKVYGAWSDEYTLKETLNKDEILAALRQYTIDYAKENLPEFQYLDDRTSSTPENSSYYVQGEFAGFSMYAKQEDVIEAYKDNISRYINRLKTSGGEKSGFLYIRKSHPGDSEGISENTSDLTYYAMWMLY